MKKKRLLLFGKIIVSAVLIILLLQRVGISETAKTLVAFDFLYLPLIIAAHFLNLLLGSANIFIIASAVRNVHFWKMFKYYMICQAVNIFAPGKAGELSLAYLLRKEGFLFGEALIIPLIDIFATLSILAAFSAGWFFSFLELGQALFYLAAVLAVLLVFLSLLSERVRHIIKRFVLRKYSRYFKRFSSTARRVIFENKRVIIVNYIITIAKYLLMCLIVFLVFAAFGSPVHYGKILLINATITIVSLIPISLDGLGLREISAVYLYGLAGISSEVTLSVYIILLIIKYVQAALVTALV